MENLFIMLGLSLLMGLIWVVVLAILAIFGAVIFTKLDNNLYLPVTNWVNAKPWRRYLVLVLLIAMLLSVITLFGYQGVSSFAK